MRSVAMAVFSAIAGILFLSLIGCRLFEGNPGGPGAVGETSSANPETVGRVRSVAFRIAIPGGSGSALKNRIPSFSRPASDPPEAPDHPVSDIRPEIATQPIQVTFKLILVNLGNAANPTTTLCKTVTADASGTAQASFTAVPACTCVGDIHIQGGRIGSYTDFHGAADLLPDADNMVVLGAKGSRTAEDVLAEVVTNITADPQLFALATWRLAARIATCLTGRDLSDPLICRTVTQAFQESSSLPTILGIGGGVDAMAAAFSSLGGLMTLASQGSSLNGLQVEVPQGAFSVTTELRVTVSPIATYALGVDIKPVTPLISLDAGGLMASEPVQVTIPFTIGLGALPIPFRFDPITGELECLPIVGVDQASLTVAIRDLSGLDCPSAAVRSGWRAGLVGTATTCMKPGIVVFEVPLARIPETLDSGFRPGIHTWSQGNPRTILAPEGACGGSSLSSLWCFNRGIAPPLFTLADFWQTPDIKADDAPAIRLVSVVHQETDWRWLRQKVAGWTFPDDRRTFDHIRAGLFITGKPQLVEVWGDWDGRPFGQALVVHRVQGNNLYVADPNQPSSERAITLDGGRFQPFSLALNADGPQITLDRFTHIGVWALLDGKRLAQHWAAFQARTVGQDRFPKLTLLARNPAGEFVELTDGFLAVGSRLQVAMKKDGVWSREFGLQVYRSGQSGVQVPVAADSTTWPDRLVFDLPLNGGSEALGLRVGLVPEGKTPDWRGIDLWVQPDGCPAVWAGFQWVRVEGQVAPAGIHAVGGDSNVTLSWDAVPGASSYNVYWSNRPGVTRVGGTPQSVQTASFDHAGLTNGIPFYYVVTAVTAQGETAESREVPAMPLAGPPTVVDLGKTVASLTQNLQVILTGVPADFSTAVALADGLGSSTFFLLRSAALSWPNARKVTLAVDGTAVRQVRSFTSLGFSLAPPAGARIEVFDPEEKSVVASATVPGGSGVPVSLGKTLTGLNQNVQVVLTQVPADFEITTSLLDRNTREEITLAKSAALSFPGFQRLVLTTGGVTVRELDPVATLTFSTSLPPGARIELVDTDRNEILAAVIIPGGGATSVSLGSTVTGMNQNLQVIIKNTTSDFVTSTVVYDEKTGEAVTLTKSAAMSYPNFTQLVLAGSDMGIRTLRSFSTLEFTAALPSGATVEIYDPDGERTVLTKTIP